MKKGESKPSTSTCGWLGCEQPSSVRGQHEMAGGSHEVDATQESTLGGNHPISPTLAKRAVESCETDPRATSRSNMYHGAKTWNPFKGCGFDCAYCGPSFRLQAKRQKHNCMRCYEYVPHFHPERLGEIPPATIVFVCGNGDIAFASTDQMDAVIASVADWTRRHPQSEKVFYFQTKKPQCLQPHLTALPPSAIIVTTLETNRDRGYEAVSTKAPPPSERYRQFLDLDYPRKIVTIEPVMDFDVDVFASWIIKINPELVYLGFNSRLKPKLPEPTPDKLVEFAKLLGAAGISIVGKTLRGLELTGVSWTSELQVETGDNPEACGSVAASCPAAPKAAPSCE